MGLDYLNKKVWHPGSMKNIQKVWDAQQAQLEVIKRQKERAKKLLDEQYNQEMKRIQVEAGLIPKSHLDRMDWMYDWGNKLQQQKNNEEFLTGAKKASKKEVKHIFQEEATNRKCEDFVLLHEDPMYAIQREELRAREAVMNNPVEMKKIIQEVEQDYLKEYRHERKDRKAKKDKKDKKKHKKDNKSTDFNSSPQKLADRKRKRQKSSSGSSSSSNSQGHRSRDKKSKSSKLYEEYLKSKFGSILKKDEEGNLVPDYGMHKKKYRTQMQMDEEEMRHKLNDMRENARALKQRSRSGEPREHQKPEQQDKNPHNYEMGLASIRQKSLQGLTSKESKYNRRRSQSP